MLLFGLGLHDWADDFPGGDKCSTGGDSNGSTLAAVIAAWVCSLPLLFRAGNAERLFDSFIFSLELSGGDEETPICFSKLDVLFEVSKLVKGVRVGDGVSRMDEVGREEPLMALLLPLSWRMAPNGSGWGRELRSVSLCASHFPSQYRPFLTEARQLHSARWYGLSQPLSVTLTSFACLLWNSARSAASTSA